MRRISTGSAFEATLGYSRAVIKGDWCFMAGVTGYDYETMTIPSEVQAQAQNCLTTVARVLSEGGFALEDIVRVLYVVKSEGLIAQVAPVLGKAFAEIRPAATMIVADLIKAELLFEIEVTAFRG